MSPSLGIPGVFNPKACLFWASGHFSSTVQILLPQRWLPRGCLLREVVILLTTCWSLQLGGGAQQFTMWSHFNSISKKSCWLFRVFFSFSFVVRTEWWPLSSSHVGSDTWSLVLFSSIFFSTSNEVPHSLYWQYASWYWYLNCFYTLTTRC